MKLQLWSTVPMDLFFGFDSPFLGIFKVYWRLSLWLALPRDGVPNFFFLFLGGDASCSHAATSHFCWCFEFQEQRTGFKSQHLRKQPIGTKVSLVRKQTHEQKGKHNKTQVQPALPYNSTWCYTWYFQPFFFSATAPVGLGKFKNGHLEIDVRLVEVQKICIFVVKLGC